MLIRENNEILNRRDAPTPKITVEIEPVNTKEELENVAQSPGIVSADILVLLKNSSLMAER